MKIKEGEKKMVSRLHFDNCPREGGAVVYHVFGRASRSEEPGGALQVINSSSLHLDKVLVVLSEKRPVAAHVSAVFTVYSCRGSI